MQAAPPELEVLFIDMNAYFASVEQMDHPEHRGRPLAVTPVLAPTGCCIACSYEARAFGVKTGCCVRDAKRACKDIAIVRARPDRYVRVHHQILDAIDSVVPVTQVDSIDECWTRLLSNERPLEIARGLALGVKAAIRERVGPLTCSIGIAPNRLIAKTASDMRKPDGLTIIPRSSLPGILTGLSLTDFPGISKGVNRRLRAAGIHTVEDLYARTPEQLRRAWGSVLGVYWWHWLRGDRAEGPATRRRTVGHQHVLAPQFRTTERARGVSLRLLSKAAQRMRSLDYVATRLSLWLELCNDRPWRDWAPVARTNDTIELNRVLLTLWKDAPGGAVLQVGVRLEDLEPIDTQLPLFPEERARRSLMEAIDRINRKGGADTIYLASMHHERKTAPRRIPFGAPPDLNLPDSDGSDW
ncbi:MAG: DUF4113 domain-containing protein [Phycisphaeraceae bacterium]|nr:DUF4113 domain-containing protein [Phycisphaeraceae bacterium]MCB9847496.1 DUF4113 domain-containing protein [Phycisphaeraceae bacterium]